MLFDGIKFVEAGGHSVATKLGIVLFREKQAFQSEFLRFYSQYDGEDVFGNKLVLMTDHIALVDIYMFRCHRFSNPLDFLASELSKRSAAQCVQLGVDAPNFLAQGNRVMPKTLPLFGGKFVSDNKWTGPRANLGFYEYVSCATADLPDGTHVSLDIGESAELQGKIVRS